MEDNDTIYGVIKGTAVNHGGSVSSLTVPNLNAQADVIMTAVERAKIGVDTISYIETHGTGTSLGDPIEVNGLKKAFRLLQKKQGKSNYINNYCGLGTVKTNVGHLEAAAGITGVIKILLAMQHQKLPGILNFNELNPYIQLQDSPFYIVEKTQDWIQLKDESGQEIPRRAGVSSFGFGGANAHIIIEEPPISNNISFQPEQAYYLIALSAKTNQSLNQKVIELADWLAKQIEEPLLENISYTLNEGRSHFEKRFALVVSNINELKEKLEQIRKGETVFGYFYSDVNVEMDEAPYKKLLRMTIEELKLQDPKSNDYKENLEVLANLYTKGYDFEWDSLYQNGSKKRILLPPYPFMKERYWIPNAQSTGSKKQQEISENARKDLNKKAFEDLSFTPGSVPDSPQSLFTSKTFSELKMVVQDQTLNDLEKILNGLQRNEFTTVELKNYISINK